MQPIRDLLLSISLRALHVHDQIVLDFLHFSDRLEGLLVYVELQLLHGWLELVDAPVSEYEQPSTRAAELILTREIFWQGYCYLVVTTQLVDVIRANQKRLVLYAESLIARFVECEDLHYLSKASDYHGRRG